MPKLLADLVFQNTSAQKVAPELALMMGRAGAIPAATSADAADFLVIVPFNITALRLKATAKTAPTSATTMQIRRSTDGGDSFSDAFGTVQLGANSKDGVSDPANLDLNEGDVLQFSVTVGGGSGTNLAVMVVGKAR